MLIPKYDINSDDPLEMIWAVREKIYKATKNMTCEERTELLQRVSERYRKEKEHYKKGKRQLTASAD